MKIRFLCVICVSVMFFAAHSVQSQAIWKQYDGPFSGDIGSITMYGDTLFASSRLTGVFKSFDEGSTWIPAITELTYVHSLYDAGNSLLIGSNKLYRYTDESQALVQLGQEVEGVISYMHIMNDKLFVTTDYSIYRYEPETDSLIAINTGIPGLDLSVRWTRDLKSIDGVLFCNVLPSGIYKSTDEGEHWEKMDVLEYDWGFLSIETHHDSLFCIANDNVFLSTNKGETWSDIKYDLPPGSYFNIAIHNNTAFLASWKGVFRLDENLNEWTNVLNQTYQSYFPLIQLEDMLFISDGVGLYKWNGTQFVASYTGLNTSSVSDVEVFNQKLYSGTFSGLHVTTPGTDDWQAVPGLSTQMIKAVVKSRQRLWIGAQYGLYGSTEDSGFTRVSSVPAAAVWDIEVTGKNIYAATDNGVHVSEDEGNTWQHLPNTVSGISKMTWVSANDSMVMAGNFNGLFKMLPDKRWRRVEFFSTYITSLNIVDGVFYASEMNSGIYRSDDYGVTWTYVNVDAINQFDMLKRGTNIYAASHKKVFYSADNGLTWDSFYETGIPDVMINCITEGENAFYVGTYGKSVWYREFLSDAEIESEVYTIENDTIYNVPRNVTLKEFQKNVSVSYGASINLESVVTHEYSGVNQITILAENGTSKTRLHVNGAPARPDVITSTPEAEKLSLEIYPVPADDKLFIKHREPIASWQVINSMGQKTAQPAFHETYFDISQLAEGMYFLVIRNRSGKSVTQRFVKQ